MIGKRQFSLAGLLVATAFVAAAAAMYKFAANADWRDALLAGPVLAVAPSALLCGAVGVSSLRARLNYGRVFPATIALFCVENLVFALPRSFATEALIFLPILAWVWFVEVNSNRE